MKQFLLFALLFISITTNAEPPKWVLDKFIGLSSADSSVRQKSAYGLKGYYTDNGTEPTQKDLNLLESNVGELLSSLSDENLQVRYYITELVAARYINQYPKPPIVFVSLLEEKNIKLFKNKFFNNLNLEKDIFAKSSMKALINLKECGYLPEMLIRAEGLSKYEKKYALKSLARFKKHCEL
ncbi:MAG: hypothetical protein ACI8SR_000989 [Oceanicoccus sp.]|jgi:hypothetical protein